jgi:TPR repeat protein
MKPLLLTTCSAVILFIGYQGALVHSLTFGQEKKSAEQKTNESINGVRKAAEQGNAEAQFNLGFMYAHGQGVPQDYAEAVRWYSKAAEQGDAESQCNLGVM